MKCKYRLKDFGLQHKKHPRRWNDILENFDLGLKFAAHRGSGKMGLVPENTAEAFQLAISKGLKIIELDVRISKDKVPVIFHGPLLQKTTSGKGRLEDKNFTYLKKLNWGFYTRSFQKPKQAFVLTLKDYLKNFASDIYTNIELKREFFDIRSGLEEKVIELVREFKLEKRVILSSFNLYSLRKLKKLAPEMGLGMIISCKFFHSIWARFLEILVHPDSVHYYARSLKQKNIQKWKKKGYFLITWGENSLSQLKLFFEWGVDIAIIDDLDLQEKFLKFYR